MSDEDDTKDVNGASIFSDPPSSNDDNTDDAFELNTTEALKPVEYNKVDLEDYIFSEKHKHINNEDKAKLLACLKLNEGLFEGRRGEWKGPPVSIEVEPDAKPHRAKLYPIALKNRLVFEKEIDRQCDTGAMQKLSPEEIDQVWASAAFCVAKSNGTIRVVIDFRVLNAALKGESTIYPPSMRCSRKSMDSTWHQLLTSTWLPFDRIDKRNSQAPHLSHNFWSV
jgi:hypothetical protein